MGVKLDRVHIDKACGTAVQSKKLCITVQPARFVAKLIARSFHLERSLVKKILVNHLIWLQQGSHRELSREGP